MMGSVVQFSNSKEPQFQYQWMCVIYFWLDTSDLSSVDYLGLSLSSNFDLCTIGQAVNCFGTSRGKWLNNIICWHRYNSFLYTQRQYLTVRAWVIHFLCRTDAGVECVLRLWGPTRMNFLFFNPFWMWTKVWWTSSCSANIKRKFLGFRSLHI
jgi:hypothetical protein